MKFSKNSFTHHESDISSNIGGQSSKSMKNPVLMICKLSFSPSGFPYFRNYFKMAANRPNMAPKRPLQHVLYPYLCPEFLIIIF